MLTLRHSVKHNRMPLSQNIKRYAALYAFLILPITYVILFCYVPMFGLQMAFREYDPIEGFFGGEWVGLQNFYRFFSSYDFKGIVINTLALSLYYMVVNFFAPVVLAISINETDSQRFKKTVQMVTYAPYFISVIVLVAIMQQIFSTHIGIVNNVIRALGGEAYNFMGSISTFRHMFVWSGIWQNMGYSSVIYIAALTAVDPQIYEAAIVDGASRIKKIYHIDLPSLAPTMVVMLILSAGGLMNVGFEKVYLLQNQVNISVSETIQTYVYKVGLINADFSFSTAVGMFNSVINLFLITIVNQIARRLGDTSLW